MMLRILIPAKGQSTRIPRKNLQKIGGVSLVQWAIQKCQRWYPDAEVYVASEDAEINAQAADYGCKRYRLSEDDIQDRRTATQLFEQFAAHFPLDQTMMTSVTSPFTFKCELDAALADPRKFVRSAYVGKVFDASALRDQGFRIRSQQLGSTTVLTGNFWVARQPLVITADLACTEVVPVNWISAIDIDEPKDLLLSQWLADRISLDDLVG
jgi:N-acylneuraminate cytidylyltransferase